MREFNSIEEAKEYCKSLTRHQYEFAMLNGKKVVLCGSAEAFEEELWGDAYTLAETFWRDFKGEVDEDLFTELATDIRDMVLAKFKEKESVEFITL